MSIFKSEHRDKRRIRDWLLGLLGFKCCRPCTLDGVLHICTKRAGHGKRHSDGEISWGYSDNWLEL